MNQNRLLAWMLIGLAGTLIIVSAVWSAIEAGQVLPLAGGFVLIAAVGAGVFHVVALGLDRVIRARAFMISEAMASSRQQQVPGGHLVIRHKSVVAEFIPDGVPQITAPAEKRARTTEEKNALILVEATINHEEYGPSSGQLISERDAREIGITTTPDQWTIIVKWFKDHRYVMTSNQGTMFETGETAWTIWKRLSDPTALMSQKP